MRTPLIAGNWKLNKTIDEAVAFVNELKPLVADTAGVEILLCPVFTALAATARAAQGTNIQVGGQNLYWKDSGAYTGEVSAPLLLDAGCTHVIIGHSERRGRFGVPEPDLAGDAGRVFGDTDAAVNRKLHAALQHGLVPIVCVGETLGERNDGNTDTIVQNQTRAALEGVEAAQATGLVLAYEPVWAIGTGQTCESDEADRVCGVIRVTVGELYGQAAAEAVRIQYGGSCKPDNAADLLGRPNIDGALVGGASLKADSFAQIIRAAKA
ncbi:MAG: triose-phosphate isomerase [Abitibacteriaceae bacterium]|nr:triose-phosphate isomerase [Abditibacteriaceae bacterium]